MYVLCRIEINLSIALKYLLKRVFSLFEVYRPTREFLTHMGTSPLPVKAANVVLCSALMAIEQ